MTDKQLRKLSRKELVDIIFELQTEKEALQKEQQELLEKIEDRRIAIEENGSIAEASLALNGVFSSAQAAADQYMESIRAANEVSETKIREAEQQSEALLAEANKKADEIIRLAEEVSIRKENEADKVIDGKWRLFEVRVKQVLDGCAELREILQLRD